MKNTKTTLLLAAVFGLGVALAQADDGKTLFEKNCASCHGKDGKGETKMGKRAGCKDYTDAKVQAGVTDDQALKAVKEGLKEGETVKMKPFADKLTDDEIKSCIAYLRDFAKK